MDLTRKDRVMTPMTRSDYRIDQREENDSDLSMQDISNVSQSEILRFHYDTNLNEAPKLTQNLAQSSQRVEYKHMEA